jgi:Ser/Thr protein kinase RdoA (MazF antagonist)
VEQQHWHRLLVLTAMRFWLSRLADTLLTQPVPPPGAVIKLKDPREYRNILAQHLQQKTP